MDLLGVKDWLFNINRFFYLEEESDVILFSNLIRESQLKPQHSINIIRIILQILVINDLFLMLVCGMNYIFLDVGGWEL